MVEGTVETARNEGGRETFGFLLSRWFDVHVRQISTTPEPLARLMADIAFEVRSGAGGEGARKILDPACGAGGLLLAAGERSSGVRNGAVAPVLLGVESDPPLAGLASARLGLALDGGEPRGGGEPSPFGSAVEPIVGVRIGDSLRSDPRADVRADIVLCNPSFNERDWDHEELATDVRWAYGLPPRTEPELAGVEHALARLVPGGVAVVLLPPAVASRRAGRRIRRALLRTGALRSVIALSPGTAQPTVFPFSCGSSVRLRETAERVRPSGYSCWTPPLRQGRREVLRASTGHG